MSLGFEVEINVNVRMNGGHSFPPRYKGVPLFRTVARPGVCAVIETGNTGASSTVELVSEVDRNPYDGSRTWEQQVDQIVTLAERLFVAQQSPTVAGFVAATQNVEIDSEETENELERRVGPREKSFWEKYCCCPPSQDSRLKDIQSATLSGERKLIDDGRVQINFSSNLDHIGKSVRGGRHPFAEILQGQGDLADAEDKLVRAASRALVRSDGAFGARQVTDTLIGFVYLVVHRIRFERYVAEGSTVNRMTKNRFLFLHRFDLAEVRERCLSHEEQERLAAVDLGVLHEVSADGKQAKPADMTKFSNAAEEFWKPNVLQRARVANTVGEFLRATVQADHGPAGRDTLSRYILRVADSTVPAVVRGAANIVFEGRLTDWTTFLGRRVELDELTVSESRDALRAALVRLGNTVAGYDGAPRPRRQQDERRETDRIDDSQYERKGNGIGYVRLEESSDDGLLVPLEDLSSES